MNGNLRKGRLYPEETLLDNLCRLAEVALPPDDPEWVSQRRTQCFDPPDLDLHTAGAELAPTVAAVLTRDKVCVFTGRRRPVEHRGWPTRPDRGCSRLLTQR